MYPRIVITDKISIPTYGIVFFAGFVLAVLILMHTAKKYDIYKNDVLYCSIYVVIGMGAGAKIVYFLSKVPRVILHFDTYKQLVQVSPADALGYLFGGLTFYGGLIGAIIGGYVYCRQYKIDGDKILFLVTPFIPFVHAFGRIGCFLAGCCYGREYHGVFAVVFPYNEADPILSSCPRVPVQLMECAFNLIIFGVLLLLRNKKGLKLTGRRLLLLYLAMYAVGRFFLEYLRGDLDGGSYRYFSTSQIISIFIILFVTYCFAFRDKEVRKS